LTMHSCRITCSLSLALIGMLGVSGCATDDPIAANAAAVDETIPESTALRFSHMEIRDPHIFLDSFFCADITTVANGLLDQSLTLDKSTPADGILDTNIVPVFQPFDPAAASAGLRMDLGADCSAPADTTTCTSSGKNIVDTVATNASEGTCLDVLEGTNFAAYTPAIVTPAAPCFVSGSTTLDVSLGAVTVHLEDARVAGRYEGGQIKDGLLRGFVSLERARTTVFPSTLAFVGGKTLAQLLAGGDNFCSRPDGGKDLDVGPDGVTPGWYFYLNYTGTPVPYTAAPAPAPEP
jgi:hypothetical protein